MTGGEAVGTSFHGGEVVPKVREAVGAAEQRGEVGGVDEHDVADALAGGIGRMTSTTERPSWSIATTAATLLVASL